MADVIVTGASRGIGRALAVALAGGRDRLLLVARDVGRLAAVAAEVERRGGRAVVVAGDLSSLAGARALGAQLAALVEPGATLIHNAGLWPSKRVVGAEGFEAAFVVNHLAPLALQAPLVDGAKLRRILVVGAGLMVKGRFDPARTPSGDDFSGVRTYCTTKLCFAVAIRAFAAAHPELDVLVVHPGVVRTELGARRGPVGWLLALVKRGWEAPEICAARLARILAYERWSPPGEARWWVEEREQPWPPVADDPVTRRAIADATAAALRG